MIKRIPDSMRDSTKCNTSPFLNSQLCHPVVVVKKCLAKADRSCILCPMNFPMNLLLAMKMTSKPQPSSRIWCSFSRQLQRQLLNNRKRVCKFINYGCTTFLLLPAFAAETPFTFKQWSSRKDSVKIIEARIDHIPSENEVVIALKNGGRRVTLNRENL